MCGLSAASHGQVESALEQIGSVHVTDPCAASLDAADAADAADAGLDSLLVVAVHRLDPELPLPIYAHPGDAGADLVSRVELVIRPGERVLVPTGVAIALPPGHAGFVHPRSGLAARHGISIVNAPGTIDEGYRGEILVNLVNLDRSEDFVIHRGDRIAQLVVQPVARARFVAVDSLDATVRGDTGHGSTGGFGAARPPSA